jgi:DNA-binding GntR family transcriptional regulator
VTTFEQETSVARPADEGRRPSLYERILDTILEGEHAPGEPLVEAVIAQRFGVSRTPVREALRRLEQDGLLRRADRGMVVRERSPEEILDIYEARIVLESSAARAAAQRHTPFDRMRLEKLLRACEQVDPEDAAELVRCNRDFHRGVWEASHNETLRDLLDRLNLHLLRYPATTLTHPGRWEQALTEHAALVEAIAARDEESAARIAAEHFGAARDIRLALWDATTV